MDIGLFPGNAGIVDEVQQVICGETFQETDVLSGERSFFDKDMNRSPAAEGDQMLARMGGCFAESFYPGGKQPDFLSWRWE